MKRKFLFLVGLCLLLPLVQAIVVYDGWVNAGEQFTAEGMTYTADYSASKEMLILDSAAGKEIIQLGECKEREEYSYCFLEADTGRAVYKDGKEYPGLNIRIERLAPEVSVQRTFSATTVQLGERIEVVVQLNNAGEVSALNVQYKDMFPFAVNVLSVTGTGTEKIPNGVSWTGVLSPGKTVSFKYILQPEHFVTYRSVGQLMYTVAGEKITKETEAVYVSVEVPFELEDALSPEEVEIGREVVYSWKLKNTIQRSIHVPSLLVKIPPRMQIKRHSNNLKEEGKNLLFTGEISGTEDFEIRFTVPSKGSYDLEMEVSVESEGETFTKAVTVPIRIGIAQIVPRIGVPEKVFSGEEFELRAVLENIGKEDITISLVELNSLLVSNVRERNIKVDKGEDREFFEKELFAPRVLEPTTFPITIQGEYLDKQNETLPFKVETQLLIEPGEDALEIRVQTDKVSVAKESGVTISVLVKNLLDRALRKVELATLIPKGVHIVEGTPTASIDVLGPGKEELAYTVELQPLAEFSANKMDLKTVGNAPLRDDSLYTTEVMTTILVGEDILAEEGTAQAENGEEGTEETEAEEGAQEGEGKPGRWRRFWNWLKGLFG